MTKKGAATQAAKGAAASAPISRATARSAAVRRVRERPPGPVLLDTAALLWWMTDPGRLSPVARALTSPATQQLLVSAVSMWEVGTKMRRGRLELPVTFADFVTTVESLDRVTIVPVDLPVWMGVVNLDWDHRDPADRIIVSTAWRHRATLITSDRAIRAFYPDTAW